MEEIKLNNIQQKIYDEYKRTGRVWAECPRQSGKTTLIIKIAVEEIKKGGKINIASINTITRKRLLNSIVHEINKIGITTENFISDRYNADVVLFDEAYYDGYELKKDQKLLCLRTRPHLIMQFSYRDLDINTYNKYPTQEKLEEIRANIGEDVFNIEFEGGLL